MFLVSFGLLFFGIIGIFSGYFLNIWIQLLIIIIVSFYYVNISKYSKNTKPYTIALKMIVSYGIGTLIGNLICLI
ncbi:hypothetical protein A2331_01835 [Candidatus Falkowbacteria bacterium RIFOXYB2_FULL_34_18]|uniref:Uncharacterized protein n=1 Tax=Candidatus Falkowbacteria bacterium RIFOXYD2_FULL_34_120 TaxID=1798007 RepID=A0A1F5TQD7_9BACT|nr:MAG: hypothetical protein A2331_01835 [Candidatus Falkowbacteria bacterium RIFOXYB2_FULL_34_18]OGF29427.1 MAG: hypothetical protein A2500_00900 [Candidatus Falkowbacteria bacterium RIFOXYC12_FULL_34_55]OGF36740.1 MAG: hypothetical protein A2466_03210 [Candidatus Falkowbacteria bacterium RIFOXYC2_FULL_34_220]OGF38953.1 MAG: hypothetical protein A2515_05325 [Candidatus Falkowbacteria bacterium RIFOXYD12_FULL_34_57]OGF41145.1 MAG: hypothetical protein A2531_01325 [Candidatus Falkowbacteria bact